MTNLKTLLIAAPVALGLLAAPAAHAEWRGHGGWGHRGYYHGGGGGVLAGALLGLGAAAVVGGIIASQPHVVYAPQPGYYAPPAYAPGYYQAPAYYAAPSVLPAIIRTTRDNTARDKV